ncbi:MAG: DUF1385 domain-containing protein [Mailhella sp.]|nr:DUF1385 domain-containing protein [Mailhella sp.]
MGGVLMRNGGLCSLAVRRPGGAIAVERRGWRSMAPKGLRSMRFVRGFPILVETLANGVRALNRSAEIAAGGDEKPMSGWQVGLSMVLALCLAVLLFVAAPHAMALGMELMGLGGSMEGFTFHLWAGIFKLAIFVGYMACISLIPDIRSVFEYHGAEHKTIHAFESNGPVTVERARACSRLHPRCGTTFMLFVLAAAIMLHTVLVPALLLVWNPSSEMLRHAGVVLFKVLLIVPVSSLAYELIRATAAMKPGVLGGMLRAPGLFLQRLTTREPDDAQLEVAIESLRGALDSGSPYLDRFEPSGNSLE